MVSDPIISIRAVVYSYRGAKSSALDGVSLDVRQGEWIALLGANGSGKSTLAKLCNALLTPAQGACFVLGLDSSDVSNTLAIRQKVALVFQNPEDQIVASLVEEDVAFGPENLRLPPEEIRRRVDSALAKTGLEELRRSGSYSLSGGQKQRLALAGALALEPEILVLDESTSMLDPQGRQSFVECLRELNETGMTIIQITHSLDDITYAGRVVVLESGRLVWDGDNAAFMQGEYLRMGFEEPGELALYRELSSRGLAPLGTPPRVGDLLEALCL